MIEFDKPALKEYIRDELYTRSSALLEMYSDKTLAGGKQVVPPSKDSLKKFMTTWRVSKGPFYDYNTRGLFDDPLEDGDQSDTESTYEYDAYAENYSPNYLRLAKMSYSLDEDVDEQLYQEYASTVPVLCHDESDDTFTILKQTVTHAAKTGTEIELLLDDGNDIILDVHTITRLYNDEQLLNSLYNSLDSIYSVAGILDLDVEHEDTQE